MAKDAVFSLKFKGEPPKFNLRHNQRPLTLLQKQFFNAKINELVEAGVIAPISPNEVKFVAPTVLAQKTHNGGGLLYEEIIH